MRYINPHFTYLLMDRGRVDCILECCGLELVATTLWWRYELHRVLSSLNMRCQYVCGGW